MNTVIYGQPLISNVNKETSKMKNETNETKPACDCPTNAEMVE
jgi:hypothetical protein